MKDKSIFLLVPIPIWTRWASLDINCPALLNVLQGPENVLHSGYQRDLKAVSGWDITQGKMLLDCINKPELVEGDGHFPAAGQGMRLGWEQCEVGTRVV